ncbi:MAG: deoxyribonuclease IV [Candidatus Margulisbacteria bacterium]|nr:deoxyribonuclease IV [Candidatus Margulisiibacteriota bacterium]
MRLLGAHMSTAGGVDKAIERGQSIGCTAIQIFVKNNNQWMGKPLTSETINQFKLLQASTGMFVFAHTGYLINLASEKTDNHEKSMQSMRQELELAEALGLPFTVLHPGSHLGIGEKGGVEMLVKNLKTLIEETAGYKVKILLEMTAGQGTNLGHKFEQLAEMLAGIDAPERTGVCFDTCHTYAAGYNIKTKEGYEKTWEEFDKLIGLNKLFAFHLNDSKTELGSRKDRHEHIGKGTLGLETFRLLMNDKRFENLPMVLETPKDPDMKQDVENLNILKSLMPSPADV